MGENIYMDYRSGRMADDNGFRLNGISNFLALEEKNIHYSFVDNYCRQWHIKFGGENNFSPRATESAIYAENTFSFPSAHSMMAMAFFGFIVYILLKRAKKRKYKIIIFCVGLMLILFVGLSRLYLGVHFLSDVLGGYLFGLLWLVAGIVIFERLNLRDKSVSHSPSRMIKIISCILIVIQLIFYAYFAIKESAVPNTRTEPAELAIFDNLAIKLYS